jgi:hypothetical protein
MNTKMAGLIAMLLVSMAVTVADAGSTRVPAGAPAMLSNQLAPAQVEDPGCCPENGDSCDMEGCCATRCVTR